MEFEELIYRYLNGFVNTKELSDGLESLDLSNYSSENKKAIEELIISINNIKDNLLNEEVNNDISSMLDNEDLGNCIMEIFSNKEVSDESLEQHFKEISSKNDDYELYKRIVKYIIQNELFINEFSYISNEELLNFITKHLSVLNPPFLTQEGFNDLAKIAIENDEREKLWRLAFNYEEKGMDFSLIEDHFIDKRDDDYLLELISIVKEELDLNKLTKKIGATRDKEFINNCIGRAIAMGYLNKEDINKLVISTYTYEDFKIDLLEKVSKKRNSEYPFILNDSLYKIIGYNDSITIQKFDTNDKTVIEEKVYKDIDELYYTQTLDGILLSKDWDKIKNPNYL